MLEGMFIAIVLLMFLSLHLGIENWHLKQRIKEIEEQEELVERMRSGGKYFKRNTVRR